MFIMTTQQPFKEYLFNFFAEWEKTQPKKRSSFSAFARWLSDNSTDTLVKQQNVDSWMNGAIPKDHKYVIVLAEKTGDEIYEVLDLPKPNPRLQRINRIWEFLPEKVQIKIEEEAAQYEAENIADRVQKAAKRRKTGESK